MLTYFRIARGYFHFTAAQRSRRDRDHMAHKAEPIYYLARYGKGLPTLALRQRVKSSGSEQLVCARVCAGVRNYAAYGG